ncbi:flagellar FlbD family protein [Arthrobacter echini]|uniref:Flagellar FlbD family protein n=1 Tax=Arthrobacter echini TaxID=1529066 RepID=A0A5D0XQ20_9MICC|nr:flagellar FlbD family protein [Arthrobacter echini]TYC98359.1 flagellar FlbD family protein [Arthrobacter echini]
MIVVTRLNESQFAVNPDLIERIHENPDTTLVMIDGAKYIVTESLDEVIDLIATYRARIITLARFASEDHHDPHGDAGDHTSPRPLGIVRAVHPAGTPEPPTDRHGAAAPVPLRPRNS